jgi:hypothetical protein
VVERLKQEGWGPPKSSPAPTVTPPKRSSDAGFVQFEKSALLLDTDDLRIGQIIKMNYWYANRGYRPVSDVQAWGLLVAVAPELNPVSRLREIYVKTIQESYKKFKGVGPDLGVSISAYGTAFSPPLTQEQIDGLKAGTLRLHFIAGGAWTNYAGKASYWFTCEWTNWPGNAGLPGVWKNC